MYPEIQEKVYKEIIDVIGSECKDIEYSHLGKLTYLDMCIKDVLRLFPIAPFIMRKASADCYIGVKSETTSKYQFTFFFSFL